MPKSRKSARNKKKSSVTHSVGKRSNSSKNRNAKSKAPQTARSTRQNPHSDSSHSNTSPFKGYPSTHPEPKLFGSLLSDEAPEPDQQRENKDDVFDRLLDDGHRNQFNRKMRTYGNRKKAKPANGLLEFDDGKNRADVLQWLNDTRNVFDRLTQTQAEGDAATQSSFEMPSVSQKPRSSRASQGAKKPLRSPYKLRARSLDIQVKKNGASGRNKRHSLAGETPEMENYQIEDVTDEDVAVPAEKEAKIIIDLMEDEYLDNIEREMQNERKNHNLSGWERIKDVSRSLNRQPKQLKVVVKESPKKEADLLNNNRSYDYDLVENYFIENMEKLMKEEKSGGIISKKRLLQAGKDFVEVLKKMIDEEGKENLNEFKTVVNDLKNFFKSFAEVSTQTYTNYANKTTQIEQSVEDMGVQTETNAIHACVQTIDFASKHHKLIQVEVSTNSVEIQTVSHDVKQSMLRQTSTASTTPSDIFALNDEEKREINDAFDADFYIEPTAKLEKENAVKSQGFEDDIDFDFNTEDILKGASKQSGGRDDVGASAGSVLVVSGPNRNDDGLKGVKRLLSDSPVSGVDKYRPKRPCAQFLNEGLSVAFSDGEEEEEEKKVVVELSDDNDSEYNHCLDKVLKKYKSPSPNVPPKTRTQEQIEELEEIIANARKPHRVATPSEEPEHHSPCNPEDVADYFKPSSYFSDSEKTPKIIRRNLFDAQNGKDETSPNAFSESMFASDRNVTVVANRTLTEDNVDALLKRVDQSLVKEEVCDVDKEVEDIMKVTILENVVVKRASSVKEEGLSRCSDEDIVESTPQKMRFSSFHTEREESALDVTLPPPIGFQDSEKPQVEDLVPKSEDISEIFSPPRRPLAVINKVTSTPTSQKHDSENIDFSPISFHCKKLPKTPHDDYAKRHSSPTKQASREWYKSPSDRENHRAPGPYELAKQQFSKFCPLTIVKKPQSQDRSFRLSSTPKQKSILTYVRSSQEGLESPRSQKAASFEGLGRRKPCIACSRVSKEQVIAISSLTNKKLATYSTSFTPKVTHLIVATNEKNCLKDHTIKFVSAVAAGVWVLNFKWVQQCLLKNALVPEEPYEVLDVSGAPGPQRSRLTRSSKPLFRGYKIHAATPFASTTQEEVENVVRLLGGKVVPSPEHLLDKNGYVCVIVTEARATQDFELYETWLEALKVVTVDIEWLSRSVGQYNLLSLRPFTLCSDDNIENLGYPSQLTMNMTYSFSQQTFSSVPSSV